MIDNINVFFDQFVEDFPAFDGKVLATRYLAPYTAVSSDGDLWLCREYSDIVIYLQSLLDRHTSQGVVACRYEDLEYTEIGKSSFLVSVTWTMSGEENKLISKWRESYNLVKTDAGLKIFTSIDN